MDKGEYYGGAWIIIVQVGLICKTKPTDLGSVQGGPITVECWCGMRVINYLLLCCSSLLANVWGNFCSLNIWIKHLGSQLIQKNYLQRCRIYFLFWRSILWADPNSNGLCTKAVFMPIAFAPFKSCTCAETIITCWGLSPRSSVAVRYISRSGL